MKVAVFSHPKDRAAIIPSDDVVLTMPGVFGVFDGATDPKGVMGTGGKSSGLFAAEVIARQCGRLFSDVKEFDIPILELITELSFQLEKASNDQGYQSRPTATLAITLIGPEKVRIIVVGDSGVRVNGTQIFRHLKVVDDVSAAARVNVFNLLIAKGKDSNSTEMLARKAIFQGIDTCVSEGVLNEQEANDLIADVADNLSDVANFELINSFIRKGIKSQSDFGNDDNHPLGFSVLNGSLPSLKDVIDVSLDIEDVESLELFTDGYFDLPKAVSIDAWEQTFAETEIIDPHKINEFPNVKGSTTTDFSDDRSVIVLTNINK